MNDPLWLENIDIPRYPVLTNDLEVDVCIVGAGMTGIILTYLLRDSGLKIALIDSDQVLHGTTAYTTAKLTSQHGLIYDDLIKNFGPDQARLYYQSQEEAIQFIHQLVKDLKIDCDFEVCSHYVFTQKTSNISKFETEFEACQALGIDCELVDELDLPFSICKAIEFKNQAQFHPLKFLVSLLKELSEFSNVSIYEQVTARDLTVKHEDTLTILTSNDVTIQAKKVVQACHFPFFDNESLLFSKIKMSHSYLIAVENVTPLPHEMYISYESPIKSIRRFNQLLLVGGEEHHPGTVTDTREKYESLINFANQQFNSNEIYAKWSTQDYISIDHMPYVGVLNEKNPSLFVATGYCKWGMTNGTAAALLLNDLIREKQNSYTSLFIPNRLNSKIALKNLVAYNSKIAFEYLKGKLKIGETDIELNPGQASILSTDEGKYGVFKDDNGEVFILDITCPHLGCELAFNTAEKTWDCPCHGSRFSYKGDVIEGPAHDRLNCHKNKIDPNIFKA